MSLGNEQEAFSRDVCQLLAFAFGQGYEVRMGEAQRPVEMQELYVRTGRSKTMNSNHIRKCAIDLHFFKDGVLCYPKELGDFWENLHPKNSWGGNWKNFKDGPHFERRP